MRLAWRVPRLLVRSCGSQQRRTLLQPSFDYKYIRDNADRLLDSAAQRNVRGARPHRVGELYDEFRALVSAANEHRSTLNAASKELGALARAGKACKPSAQGPQPQSEDPAVAALREQAMDAKLALQESKARLAEVEAQLQREAARIPNTSHPDTPVGDESCARVVRICGDLHNIHKVPLDGVDTRALSDADFRDHYDLALRLGIVDMEAGAKVAGSRFHYWRGAGALLELALVQFAMTRAAAAGFTLHITPDAARSSVVDACGFQPRPGADEAAGTAGEASQIYRITPVAHDAHGAADEDDPLCLVATAEIPLVAMKQQQLLGSATLPMSLAGMGHCFRAEAGARGRDTRGIYRLHQFTKVELVVLALPEHSDAELARLVSFQESLYADLGLTFRVLQMPTQELGASAYQKFDVEAWMPGRGAWGEIASASNCTDYQARRLGIRVRSSTAGAAPAFVHTLNATAVAVPRLVVALLESFQRPDGSVVIPAALRPWMMGRDVLDPADAGA
ncbi:seryl-tRNA synthetase [Coemansia biformis]|uniref:serine--tRNA ligase n=1 Tax=Coemansia biformis TaxID=1286918 RepID=A0A9W8CXS7_9FUNG|nr:seryl-tRNA synthetase [Coemansia biformis]